MVLAAGEAHDLVGADQLLPHGRPSRSFSTRLDAPRRVVQPLAAAGKITVISPKKGRKLTRDSDRELYKARHLNENFYARLKQYSAIATRYDKTVEKLPGGKGSVEITPV